MKRTLKSLKKEVTWWQNADKSCREAFETAREQFAKERTEWRSKEANLRKLTDEVRDDRNRFMSQATAAEERVRRLEQTIQHLGLAFASIGGKGMV